MMTTMQKAPEVTGPQALSEDHHEAIRASWELPAYERQAPPTARTTRPLVVGILVGAVSLAVGFGAGYWAHSHMVEAVAPIVISRVAGPIDANGMNLGRRVAPLETTPPIGISLGGPAYANGARLGRRVAPFDTLTPDRAPGGGADRRQRDEPRTSGGAGRGRHGDAGRGDGLATGTGGRRGSEPGPPGAPVGQRWHDRQGRG